MRGQYDSSEIVSMGVVTTVGIGSTIVVSLNPAVQPIGIAAIWVGVAIFLVAPYLNVPYISRTVPVIGVGALTIGIFGFVAGGAFSVLFLLFILGGVGMLLEDGYRRMKGDSGHRNTN